MASMEHSSGYDIHSLDGALAASEAGELKQWLKEFLLHGMTPNVALVEGLGAVLDRTYHGPILLPLDELTRICGPESHMKYKVDGETWEKKIRMLVESIDAGWKPQPLLTPGKGGDAFKIHDGNNRHEALVRSGRTHYWTILHFENESDKEDFIRKHQDRD